jgi:hypothetical protein
VGPGSASRAPGSDRACHPHRGTGLPCPSCRDPRRRRAGRCPEIPVAVSVRVAESDGVRERIVGLSRLRTVSKGGRRRRRWPTVIAVDGVRVRSHSTQASLRPGASGASCSLDPHPRPIQQTTTRPAFASILPYARGRHARMRARRGKRSRGENDLCQAGDSLPDPSERSQEIVLPSTVSVLAKPRLRSPLRKPASTGHPHPLIDLLRAVWPRDLEVLELAGRVETAEN